MIKQPQEVLGVKIVGGLREASTGGVKEGRTSLLIRLRRTLLLSKGKGIQGIGFTVLHWQVNLVVL